MIISYLYKVLKGVKKLKVPEAAISQNNLYVYKNIK